MTEEDYAQITVADWCKAHNIEMIHIANERKTNLYQGRILKRKGVMAGVPDCYFPIGNEHYPALWIELKIHPNKPTKAQEEFLTRRANQGHAAMCIKGKSSTELADNVILFLKEFYSL